MQNSYDDPEPWTETWLKSIGFLDDDQATVGVDYLWINDRDQGMFDLQYHRAGSRKHVAPNVWVLADGGNDIVIPAPTDRGEVRRLCAALGIPIDEDCHHAP